LKLPAADWNFPGLSDFIAGLPKVNTDIKEIPLAATETNRLRREASIQIIVDQIALFVRTGRGIEDCSSISAQSDPRRRFAIPRR
jgi:hypothetical protein